MLEIMQPLGVPQGNGIALGALTKIASTITGGRVGLLGGRLICATGRERELIFNYGLFWIC
jgi:hypothetical protein